MSISLASFPPEPLPSFFCVSATTERRLDFTTAERASGAMVVDWLETTDLLPADTRHGIYRVLHRWRNSATGQVSFHALDRTLKMIGVHPCELPSEVWAR